MLFLFTVQVFFCDRLFTLGRGGSRFSLERSGRLFGGVAIGKSMMRRSGFQVYGWIVGLCACVILFVSCESRDRYVGVYRAEGQGAAKQEAIILELKANGDGLWRVSSR